MIRLLASAGLCAVQGADALKTPSDSFVFN